MPKELPKDADQSGALDVDLSDEPEDKPLDGETESDVTDDDPEPEEAPEG